MGTRFSKLGISFSPEIHTENDRYGTGYRILINAPWHNYPNEVLGFRIQLTGKNPLTGKDVAEQNYGYFFSFDSLRYRSPILTFHGNFVFNKYICYKDGTEEFMGSIPQKLYYQPNEPYVRFSVAASANKNGHKWIQIESNCWRSCEGKIWLIYDGRAQKLPDVSANSGKFKWYLPTQEKIDIHVADDMIRLVKIGS